MNTIQSAGVLLLKSLYGLGPAYMKEHILPHQLACVIRSSAKNLLWVAPAGKVKRLKRYKQDIFLHCFCFSKPGNRSEQEERERLVIQRWDHPYTPLRYPSVSLPFLPENPSLESRKVLLPLPHFLACFHCQEGGIGVFCPNLSGTDGETRIICEHYPSFINLSPFALKKTPRSKGKMRTGREYLILPSTCMLFHWNNSKSILVRDAVCV